jgi:type VI secretion system protein ImpH
MLSDWLGMQVEVVEYAGAWLRLPPPQRTRIGVRGVFSQLGVDAAVGVRAWSPEARILIGIGPLSWDGFQLLLPDTRTLQRVVSLVRAFIGMEQGFVISPVLAADQVVPLRLNAAAAIAPMLGWNTWLPLSAGSGKRQADAADAVFDSDVIEDWAQRRLAQGQLAQRQTA